MSLRPSPRQIQIASARDVAAAMNFDSGVYAESDADDEYERDMPEISPTIATDVDMSPIDSDAASTENTPTTHGYHPSPDRLPETISEWTADECADFITNIGLQQYADIFLENEIVGEALVALHHDDLRQMGIKSLGHRMRLLKNVYDVKIAHEVPIENDHFVPTTAETEAQAGHASMRDINRLMDQLRRRDERISMYEQEMRRMADDFRRLREDMLPALRLAKDVQQPLPNLGNGQNYENIISPPAPTPSTAGPSAGLKRQYSTKKIMLDERPYDPTGAAERAVMSSSHLAAMNGGGSAGTSATSPSYPSPNIPSPTSPLTITGTGTILASRSYRSDQATPSSRLNFPENDHYGPRDPKPVTAPRRMQTSVPDTPNSSSSVEIFKSFRVSMDDPCHKVLPAALKKYQIHAPWDQYALYIVYGDQERCLGHDEKPLILFKQLDKEGKKPMFMLRKTNNAQVDLSADVSGSAGLGATARGASTGYDPPGGII